MYSVCVEHCIYTINASLSDYDVTSGLGEKYDTGQYCLHGATVLTPPKSILLFVTIFDFLKDGLGLGAIYEAEQRACS